MTFEYHFDLVGEFDKPLSVTEMEFIKKRAAESVPAKVQWIDCIEIKEGRTKFRHIPNSDIQQPIDKILARLDHTRRQILFMRTINKMYKDKLLRIRGILDE